jgi:glycosyltransferase involved in cell wall biosynthesis
MESMPATADPTHRRPLAIVHTVSSLKVGGMEQFVLRLASEQALHGHRVSVLALRGGPLYDLKPAAPVDVRVLEGSSGAWRWARALAYLASLGPDVVHAHNPTSLQYAAAGKAVRGAKVVLTDHGQCGGIARVPRRWELALTDAFVSVSAAVADRHKSLYGPRGRAKKYAVIRNGIEFAPARRPRSAVLDELALPPGLTGVVAARLEPVKDHETLLGALALLGRQGMAVNLLLAGDGSERPRLEALVPQLGLDPARIRFLGFRHDVPDLLSAADFFVLSSLQEGLPLAVLEAMAHRLPVVATSVGGVPEVLTDGEHGYLVPTRAVEPLAAAVANLARDPELRRKLGEAGACRVEREFSFGQMVRRYDDLYATLFN